MNMLRRSVGRAVRSRIVPYVALYAVLLALHLQFTLGTNTRWRIFRCGITIPGQPGR